MVEKIVNKLSGMYSAGKRAAIYGSAIALLGLSSCQHFMPITLPDMNYSKPDESSFLEPGYNNKMGKPEGGLEKTVKISPEKRPEDTQHLQAATKNQEPEKKSNNPLGYVLGGLIASGVLAIALYVTVKGKKKQESE